MLKLVSREIVWKGKHTEPNILLKDTNKDKGIPVLGSTFVEATQVAQRGNRYWDRTQRISGTCVQLAQDKKERQPHFMSAWKKKAVSLKMCAVEIKEIQCNVLGGGLSL